MKIWGVRIETLDGVAKWGRIRSWDKMELCKVFGFDPHTTEFDLPRSVQTGGTNSVGYGGKIGSGHIHGVIFRNGRPIGKILEVIEHDSNMRDDDPSSKSDFFKFR